MTVTIDYTTLAEQPNFEELAEALIALPVTSVEITHTGVYEENMEFEDGTVTFGYQHDSSGELGYPYDSGKLGYLNNKHYVLNNVSGYNSMYETLCQDKLTDEALEEMLEGWHSWLMWEIGSMLEELDNPSEVIKQLIQKCQPSN